jgi:hypothetical protein
MRTLSERDLVEIWERGQGRHPVDQALAVLGSALPGSSLADLTHMSIGERDGALLEVYRRSFGPRFDAVAACPRCGESVEFSFRAENVLSPPAPAGPHRFRQGDHEIDYRLPDSLDLAEIASLPPGADPLTAARALLVKRCVIQARDGENPMAAADLPAPVVSDLAAHMQAADPQAEVSLQAACPGCGFAWQMCFDVVTFLWSRIAGRARQLLQEVHLLARAYGWREADILGLSPARRTVYLELAG